MGTEAVQARREIEGEVRAVVERVALRALGQAGRPFELTIPTLGKSSLVFLVDVPEGHDFVVRVARGSKGRRDLSRRVRAGKFWARHGLPTPKVLHADLSPATRRDTGFFLLCEQRIHGGNAVDVAAGESGFAAVGRAFAQIHAVERRWHHGSFYQPRIGPYGYRQVKRHAEWTRELFDMGLTPRDLTKPHREWMATFPGVHAGGPFQLIHRRCTESDVMIDEGGEAWVLEPQRCGFGSFMTDLIRIEERIGGGDESRLKGLHTGYFGAVAPARRDVYDALAPVFRADLHLANALRWARKMHKGAGV
ncbi:MAG: phosphotransferase [Deltaproteobacteria bacterium]|nr:phosphotransferase [Deltaproteobacteria bacterium]